MDSFDRMLEEAVIGGTLLADKLPPEVLLVEPEYFTGRGHGEIWTAIADLLQQGSDVDEVTVSKAIGKPGLFVYLNRLAEDCPTSQNLGAWCKRLIDFGSKRLADNQIRQVMLDGGDPADLAQRVDQIARQYRKDKADGLRHVSGPLKELVRKLEAEQKGEAGMIAAKTGLQAVDQCVRMEPHGLTIIAARPGMGKTAFAGNIVSECAARKDGAVVLFSLEMDAVAIVRRMVAGAAGLPTDKLMSNPAKLAHAMNQIHGLDFYVDDRPGLSTADIRSALSRMGKISLVLVDYIQLAKMDQKIERHDLRVGQITKDLKAIAKHYNCHVIALSQLNRSVEQNNPPIPRLSNLRDSGNLEEDADIVLMLYRPGYYDADAGDEASVYIPKNRNGPTGEAKVFWDAKRQRFHDVERWRQ